MSKLYYLLIILLFIQCNPEEKEQVVPTKSTNYPLLISVIDLSTNTLLLKSSGDPKNPSLGIFTPEFGEFCESDFKSTLTNGSIMKMNRIQNNILRLELVELNPYTNSINVASLNSINAGFKLLFQHSNPEGEDIPLIHGETDVRDDIILGGYGINLNRNDVFVQVNDNNIYMFYADDIEITDECEINSENKVIKMTNCEFCNEDFSNEPCFFSKCGGQN